jgi:hypothetical protein
MIFPTMSTEVWTTKVRVQGQYSLIVISFTKCLHLVQQIQLKQKLVHGLAAKDAHFLVGALMNG